MNENIGLSIPKNINIIVILNISFYKQLAYKKPSTRHAKVKKLLELQGQV